MKSTVARFMDPLQAVAVVVFAVVIGYAVFSNTNVRLNRLERPPVSKFERALGQCLSSSACRRRLDDLVERARRDARRRASEAHKTAAKVARRRARPIGAATLAATSRQVTAPRSSPPTSRAPSATSPRPPASSPPPPSSSPPPPSSPPPTKPNPPLLTLPPLPCVDAGVVRTCP